LKYFKEYGFYLPSFFYIKINDNEDEERTLFHELIHFMQDISTTFGLINIFKTVDFLKEKSVICIDRKEIPLSYIPYLSNNYNTNVDLFFCYLGDGAEKYVSLNPSIKVLSINYNNKQMDGYDDLVVEGYSDIANIELEIGYGDLDPKVFIFGQRAIAESMAHELECYVYGNPCQKSYPYSAVSMIVDYIYPQLKKPLVVVELCEASLMFYHPADILIQILNQMKKNKFQYNQIGDIYTFVLMNWSAEDNLNQKTNFYDEYLKIVRRTTKQVDDLITVEPYKSKKLISGYISNAKNLREQNKPIITQLFSTSNANIIRDIGSPLIMDSNYIPYSSDSDIFIYAVIYSIWNKLDNQSESKCQFYEYCEKSPEQQEVFNDKCKSQPWKKVKEEILCPYSTIWKMWGLPKI